MNRTEPAVPRRPARLTGRVARTPALIVAIALVGVGAALAATTTTIRTANNPHLGRILEGPARYTLYVFCPGVNTTHCPGHGSSTWPPLIAHGRVVAASGSQLKSSKLSTRKLANGQHQVTYYGNPLYLYKGDRKPGQTKGEGKLQANGAWFAVNKYGSAVPPQHY
jgi:predicted lipoprotein with Yx(FWY)xxD motif